MLAAQRKDGSVQAAVLTWEQWRDAGHAPKTRDAALKIVSRHLGLDLTRVKESAARNNVSNIDDRLSLMVWDIQENDAALIDYSRDIDRIFADLLEQAGKLITRYMRARASMPRVLDAQNKQTIALVNKESPSLLREPSIGYATMVKTPQGYKSLPNIKPSDLEALAETFIEGALRQILRWKSLGVDATFVRRTLARAQERILAEFE